MRNVCGRVSNLVPRGRDLFGQRQESPLTDNVFVLGVSSPFLVNRGLEILRVRFIKYLSAIKLINLKLGFCY